MTLWVKVKIDGMESVFSGIVALPCGYIESTNSISVTADNVQE